MSTTTNDTNVVALRPRSEQPDAAAAIDDDAIVVADDDDVVVDDATDTQADHVGSPVAQLRPIAPQQAEPADAPLEHQVEALLFVSPTPLTTTQLAELTDQDEDDLHECLVDMMQAWGEGSRGIVLERVAGGWAFRASDRCREQLGKLVRPQGDTRLSPSAIETLAIVSYLQPVSRPDVAKIRGVSVDAAMTGLLERGMVEEAGRSDSGAVLFRTTAHFERAFGLSSLGALPELEGFGPGAEEVARMKEQLERMAEARVE
ncbi:MAG: chromosome segregation and condensation protein ScpB [Thermoleophilia bacterium]|jgi:segregation and condensation protein B|nr:chromosome segregation and condensation protein ScpB [Thermoleophilia bacterium]